MSFRKCFVNVKRCCRGIRSSYQERANVVVCQRVLVIYGVWTKPIQNKSFASIRRLMAQIWCRIYLFKVRESNTGLFLSEHLLPALFCRGLIAGLADWCGAAQEGFADLRKKTSRGRHGPLCPSALTLKGITERPLPQHGLHQNLQSTARALSYISTTRTYPVQNVGWGPPFVM